MNALHKLSSLILTAGLLFTATGCKDFLNLQPQGVELESNYYKTEDQGYAALVAVYDVLGWDGTNGWNMFYALSDVASDDCFAGGSDASDQPTWVALDQFTMNSTLGPQAGFWAKNYAGIYRANIFLEKIDQIEATPVFKNRTIAEAKVLRAYYYFELVRLFGRVPLIVRTLGADEFYTQTQAEPAAIYAQIEQDLNDAVATAELPNSVSLNELGRVTKGAAQSLLARVILFQNDQSRMGEVAELCKTVINAGTYTLAADFGQIFTTSGEFGTESVFEIQKSGNARIGWDRFGNGGEGNYAVQFCGMRDYAGPTYAPGYGFLPVSTDLATVMQGDPRFQYTIIDGNALKTQGASYAPGYQNTDYFVKKYAPLVNQRATEGEPAINWSNNIRVIRYSDVLLMAAEALVRGNGSAAEAQGYLNQVRSRVGLPAVTASGNDLLDAIYLERRKELALEGHRYWDLIRTGKAATVLGSTGFQAGKHEYLPLPQAELDRTNGRLQQNPGY